MNVLDKLYQEVVVLTETKRKGYQKERLENTYKYGLL